MKSLNIIFFLSISISCIGQNTVPLDSSMFKSISDSIYLQDLAFLSNSYASDDNLEQKITSNDSWFRKRFPNFFQYLDKNEKWSILLLSLDKDTSKIAHNLITSNSFDSLIIYKRSDLNSFIDSTGFNWKKYRQYSTSPEGFFQISNIVVSENQDIAVVKIYRYNDALAADAYVLLMEKINENWIVVARMLLWIS